MIARSWVAPNYRVIVVDAGDEESTFLIHADSPDQAREKLEPLGFEVRSTNAYRFKDWLVKAGALTRALLATDDHIARSRILKKSASQIWRQLKFHLFDLFNGKCAYCEAETQIVAHGDVEHYRPKLQVTDTGDSEPHYGYFWLAFAPKNLLPSCGICNSKYKRNRFPVDGRRARTPREIRFERPLLLYPYANDLERKRHLVFDKNGVAQAKSLRGQQSIDTFGLNRGFLTPSRQLAQKAVAQECYEKMAKEQSLKEAFDAIEKDLASGKRYYSAAQRDELRRLKVRIRNEALELIEQKD